MNKTQIEWVRNPDGTQGYTLNSKTGCLNGCIYCYARKEAYGRCKWADLQGYPYQGYPDNNDPWKPRWHPERLEAMWKRKKPSGIFLDDRSDWAADYWPTEWTEMEMDAIHQSPQHRIYLLTKQPQNLIKFSPFPDNCWVGVTITTLDLAREAIRAFIQIEARIKFASYEPCFDNVPCKHILNFIDWLIIGSQTKPFNPPSINKVEEIVRACDKAGVPVFLKNNLEPLFLEKFPPKPFENFGCWNLPDWAVDKEAESRGLLKLRQEMPK